MKEKTVGVKGALQCQAGNLNLFHKNYDAISGVGTGKKADERAEGSLDCSMCYAPSLCHVRL